MSSTVMGEFDKLAKTVKVPSPEIGWVVGKGLYVEQDTLRS